MAQNTNITTNFDQHPEYKPLNLLTKLIYGSGDWGRASYNTLRQIFYAIFLTDVVGLDPRLASVAALISIIWDAVNDPIVGVISDNLRTRWGRRRPFIILFSIPFSLAFVLLWWAPPWHSQILLMIHMTLAYMTSDTIQTLVTVPYLALTPELATGYDERTSLTSYRMFFNLVASLATAVAAPIIIESILKAGFSQQQGYLTVAALFGGLAALPFIAIFFFVREKEISTDVKDTSLTMRQTISILWENKPFRFATGIYVLNWIAFDVMALMLPFFLLYWIAQGNQLEKVSIFGMRVALESVVLGTLLLTATLAIPIWNFVAQKTSKRTAYIAGMTFWIIVQMIIFSVQPGQINQIIFLAFLAGLSVSTAHIMPDAIFPDVIDWDELRTHTRREGMYYGAINLIRKLSGAVAVFFALQVIGWFGYKTPPANVAIFQQPAQAITAIRMVSGPLIVFFLIIAIAFAWLYPLNRDRQLRIQISLQNRKHRQNISAASNPTLFDKTMDKKK